MNIDTKSRKTKTRIKAVEADIEHYRKSIERLKQYAVLQKQVDHTPHAPRIVKYGCIPKSAKRFQWTIKNITSQVALLEKELETLMEYGK